MTRLTNQLDFFLSKFFGVQLVTSSFCICCSIFCIVFVSQFLYLFLSETFLQKIKNSFFLLQSRGLNFFEQLIQVTVLLYSIFDIFMIMYFGSEITSWSNGLSYSLFESEWTDRSVSVQKNVVIFGEFLKRPHQLVIIKIYPLTLETFKRVKCHDATL